MMPPQGLCTPVICITDCCSAPLALVCEPQALVDSGGVDPSIAIGLVAASWVTWHDGPFLGGVAA